MKRACTAAILVLALAAPARAFTVKSGFTPGCHETLTASAFTLAAVDLPELDEDSTPGGNWERILEHFYPGVGDIPRAQRFLLFGLIVGARAPDSEGHSLTNLTVLRAVQAHPEGQYAHCLRAADDNYDAGNGSALAGCRAEVSRNIEQALEAVRTGEDVLIETTITLDAYGSFEVDVPAGAYYIGRALHTVQDSFTHTLRSPDMRRVVHVMNYEAAIAETLHEPRDGMAHSGGADSCVVVASNTGEVVNRDRVFASIEASADLLRAVSRAVADISAGVGDEARQTAEIDAVLLKWMRLADPSDLGDYDECNRDNDYCDSPWLDIARIQPAGAILGCATDRLGPGAPVVVFLALALAFLRRRRR